MVYYNNDAEKSLEVKTNATGAKLLSYIMNNDSKPEKLKPSSETTYYMNNDELEWYDLQKELNNMTLSLQQQDYEY